MGINEAEYDDVDWIKVAQDKMQWQAPENSGFFKEWEFQTNWTVLFHKGSRYLDVEGKRQPGGQPSAIF